MNIVFFISFNIFIKNFFKKKFESVRCMMISIFKKKIRLKRLKKKHASRNPKDYHLLFSNCFSIFDYKCNMHLN